MNKVAIVTGGARGIGLAISQALAVLDFELVIVGMRNESDLDKPYHDLKHHARLSYVQANIGTSEGRAVINQHVKDLPVCVLVNNAGVAPKQRLDILETTEESFDYVMDINLKGSFFLSQAIANQMLAQKIEGKIINIGSISAETVSVNRAEYCISKAGLAMMSKALAVRLGDENILVYEIRPGIIETDMTSGVKEKYDKMIAQGLSPIKRWGLPTDISKAVSSLVKGDFNFTTGTVFYIDGGMNIAKL